MTSPAAGKANLVPVDLLRFPLGEDLPAGIYLELSGKRVLLRAVGDRVDYALLERLTLRGVNAVFVRPEDYILFEEWIKGHAAKVQPAAAGKDSPASEPMLRAREDAHRTALDIFRKDHTDPVIGQAIQKSKKLVLEIIRTPYAVRAISPLQTYSRGTIDHCLNVSILATYLAVRLGYTHHVMLQHVGLGALLHDIGKRMVPVDSGLSDAEYENRMAMHPQLGVEWLEADGRVPKEVKLIVGQHHENFDGSGYPLGLKGTAIFDLSRVVSIANVFDELVANASGTLEDRQNEALKKLANESYRMFEPRKLERVLAILKKGI